MEQLLAESKLINPRGYITWWKEKSFWDFPVDNDNRYEVNRGND